MPQRDALLIVLAGLLPVAASAAAAAPQPSSLTVVVIGVPDGYSLLGHWLEKQLFARTVVPSKAGDPFSFSVQVPAGQGQLKLWVLTTGQRGVNTATAVKATLRSGRRYTVTVTSDGVHSLRATLAQDPATDIARCHGLPGSMKCKRTPLARAQQCIALDVNSGPFSTPMNFGRPRVFFASSRMPSDPHAGDRRVGRDVRTVARSFVHDREAAIPPPRGERAGDRRSPSADARR